MERMVKPDEASSGVSEPPAERFRCDFCGQEVQNVRRVALDRGYDRLRTPHRVRYACPSCSEKKDRERRARG